MNNGIAVALCICRSYWAIHTDGSWASKIHFRWSPISFFSPPIRCERTHSHTHGLRYQATKWQLPPVYSVIYFCSDPIFWSIFRQMCGRSQWIYGQIMARSGGIIQNIQLLRFNPSSLALNEISPHAILSFTVLPLTTLLHQSHQPLGQCRKGHFGQIFFCANSKRCSHCLHRKLCYRRTYVLLSEIFGGALEPWVIASHVARSQLPPLFQASLAIVPGLPGFTFVCLHTSKFEYLALHQTRYIMAPQRASG